MLTGNGGRGTSGVITAGTSVSAHFFYKNPVATPAGTHIDSPYGMLVGGGFHLGFSWDHTNANFQQSWLHSHDGAAFNAAKYTTALQTNTRYSIGVGVDGGGAQMHAYLNGALETTQGITAHSGSASVVPGILDFSTANQFDDGTIGEVAFWNALLTAAEFDALSHGFSADQIRPDALVFYVKCIRDFQNSWRGDVFSLTGAVIVADHDIPMFYRGGRQRVWAFEAGPTEFEFEGSGGLAFGGGAGLAGMGLGGIVGSGGMAFGGSDATVRNTFEGDGGMAFGGEADTTAGHITGSGGMAFGGHARGGKGGPGRGVDCGPTILGEECDT